MIIDMTKITRSDRTLLFISYALDFIIDKKKCLMLIRILEKAGLGIAPSNREHGIRRFINDIKDYFLLVSKTRKIPCISADFKKNYENLQKTITIKMKRISELREMLKGEILPPEVRIRLNESVDKLLQYNNNAMLEIGIYLFQSYIKANILNAYYIVKVCSRMLYFRIGKIKNCLPEKEAQEYISRIYESFRKHSYYPEI